MVEGISDLFKLPGKDKGPGLQKDPAPADVHALAAALNPPQGSGDLGSLFSGQMKMVSKQEKSQEKTESLDQKLGRHQNRKAREPRRDEQGADPGPEQGEKDRQEYLVQEVAAQILSGGKVEGEQIRQNEVIIRIKEEILKGCHIHLIRETDCLHVRLCASNRNTLQTLIDGQNSLMELLEKTTKGLVRVSAHLISPQKPD